MFLSSVLYVLSFPKFNQAWLAWLALVPLARIAIRQSPSRAFFSGWLAGTAAYIGLLYWVIVTFQAARQSAFLSIPCLLLLSAYLGLFWGAWTSWIAWSKSVRGVGALPFTAAAAWVGLEYLRTHLFSGFPWTLLGDTQWANIALIQITSVTGVYGITFLIVLVNCAGAWTLKRGNRVPFLTAGLVALSLLYGIVRLTAASNETASSSRTVALLQGNIDQYQKWNQHYSEEIKRAYERIVKQATQQEPLLIVWPETSVPGYMVDDPGLHAWLEGVVQRSGTYHLVGAPAAASQRLAYNTAYSFDPKGQILGQYSKHHLVPFGEVVPFAGVLGRWIGVLNELGGFAAGTESPVLKSGIGPIGVNICYEAIFPDLVRRSVLAGAEVIVNLTNDGWYMRTAAPYQHFVPNIFRAVENGRWVARANNTGITALIDPWGRVIEKSEIFVPDVLVGEVTPCTELTVYTRFGDVFAWLCLLLCFLTSVRGILRRQ